MLLEEFFTAHKDYILFLITLSSVIVVIIGWFVNSKKARNLQRKQLAIQILHENRYEKLWVDSLRKVFISIKDNDADYFTSIIAKLNSDDGNSTLSVEEESLRHSIQIVMNSFEFISIAILNEAINEDIIKWSYERLYTRLYDKLRGYISLLRSREGEESVYINFTCLVEKWHPNKIRITPGTACPTP